MLMQAVVKIGATQQLVTSGQEILILLPQDTAGKVTFDQVLLTVDGEKINVGTPFLSDIVVSGTVVGTKKQKIRVFKYKAKSRYRKTVGSKTILTKVRIDSIGGSQLEAKSTTPAAKAEKKAKTSRKPRETSAVDIREK